MHRASRIVIVAASLTVLATAAASAQERRRAAEGVAVPERPGIPRNPRFPFVGSWVGSMNVNRAVPIIFEIDLVEGQYAGSTIWPNDARAPHTNVRLVGENLHWEMKNSGEGVWVYQAKRPSADSLVGTVELRGGSGPDGKPVSGTFTLLRKPAPAERGR